MSCASGGASQGSSAIASVFQSWATSGRSPRASATRRGSPPRRRAPRRRRRRTVSGPQRPVKSSVPGRRSGGCSSSAPPAARRRRLELVSGRAQAPAVERRRPGGDGHARRQRAELATSRRAAGATPRAPASPRRRAPPRAAAAGRAARTRGTPRAAASGRARARRTRSRRCPASMSRCAVASCFEMRASSAFSRRFSLRLAPEISSMLPAPPPGRRTAGAAGRPSCRRSRGRRGCCPRCRPSGPMKSGTSSGGMP